ncbi:16S rRNA (guanine(527)-N(7))-methyltransferase RsmG [Phreatobacter aquaticus]|uniref:Ribosomal RNA small subunit methyltransferase G n=1 Tax=Phreatobacter aquaticus TaxID=2570229 RepID=A0A4D7QM20_9HYPH|nr:16S rRNA (guanine(527)-N(7))-methyltransferase RsmG [Phreatobacter aquaticus]QCK85282.1 16S rRNA (guanine(527)-N(7))-methyltransferase RsmG [Phreatobacter aquaticus]
MAANVSDRAAAEAAARQAGVAVSRETQDRLVLYVSLLRRWNPVKNLVSPHTLSAVWERHIADCLQLAALAPDARTWVDLGSGGGLPGLVIAAVLAERAGTRIHLVESKLGKAAFLREAARQMGVPATIHAFRIEGVLAQWTEPVDVVTARALAPLDQLVRLSVPLLKTGAFGLFPKGQDVGSELTQAAKYWKLDTVLTPSVTEQDGRIVTVRRAEPVAS